MGNLSFSPGCWASVVSAGVPTGVPTPLPHILEASATTTLAPAIGQARLLIADPDGAWYRTLKVNDALGIAFNSRRRQAVTAAASPLLGPTLSPRPGTTTPTDGNAWTGLIDEVFEVKDPTTTNGRACLVNASTYWKLLATTAVPLYRFHDGVYPLPGTTPQQLFEQAVADILVNTGIAISTNFEATAIQQMTPPNQIPNNFTDPQAQSWASFVLGLGVIAGLEVYFDEAGTLQVRSPKYMRNVAAFVVPDEEILRRQAGASDSGLVTNVVVAYTVVPLTSTGVESPAGGIPANPAQRGNIGLLPDTLNGPDGLPLPRLGQRFVSLQVPQFASPADAGYYAATVRMLGLAQADQMETTSILNGDVRVGTVLATPGTGKRYYLTTVTHSYRWTQQATTELSGRFGIAIEKMWDRSGLDGPNAYDQVALPGYPQAPGGGVNTTPANLPASAADPGVLITTPTLTVADILGVLSNHTPPSPFADQAGYILTEAARYGVDPSFALAVWTAETQLGSDGSRGSQGFNPGNLGPFKAYPTWANGIDAWFQFLAGLVANSQTTVSAIAPTYIPDDVANPRQMEDWIASVTGLMASIRGAATLPGVPDLPQTVDQPAAGSVRDRIIQAARTQLGLPYLMGGYAPGVTWDCSALMQWAYAQAGLSIPRTAQTQYDASGPLAESQIVPGDLVFFQHTYDTADRITHVGLALGGGQMLDAESKGVLVESYRTPYWTQFYVGAARPAALGSN